MVDGVKHDDCVERPAVEIEVLWQDTDHRGEAPPSLSARPMIVESPPNCRCQKPYAR
jgi:hypothetical protein